MTPANHHTLGHIIPLIYAALAARHGKVAAQYATALLVDRMMMDDDEIS